MYLRVEDEDYKLGSVKNCHLLFLDNLIRIIYGLLALGLLFKNIQAQILVQYEANTCDPPSLICVLESFLGMLMGLYLYNV